MNRKKFTTALLSIFALCSLASMPLSAQQQKRVTLKEITDGQFRPQGASGSFRRIGNTEYYSEQSKDGQAIVRYSFSTGRLIDTLFSVSTTRECPFDKFEQYIIGPDANHILLLNKIEPIYRRSFTAEIYEYDVRRKLVKPLSDNGGQLSIPTFSPDGRMVAFVRDNNIYIKKFDFDTEVAVTTDGKWNEVINGRTDWVYEEEFGQDRLLSFSRDGMFLAYARTDESRVKEYAMPMYHPKHNLYPQTYSYKYPKAGEKNSLLSIHLYNIDNRSTKQVDIPIDQDGYIPRLAFTGKADELAVLTLNRHQNLLKMFYVNPKSLVSRLVLEDKNERYIEESALHSFLFLSDGFVYLSERDGYRHLYHYNSKGVLLKQVTKGNWDVTLFYGMDPAGNYYYQAAETSPLNREVYRIDRKGRKTRLSPLGGTNNARFSGDFAYFINSQSSIDKPLEVALYKTSEAGKPLRVLQDNAELKNKLRNYQLGQKEFITLKNKAGQEMNAWIIKPLDFTPQKQYPLLMVQYSGPNSQQVTNSFSLEWEQYLAAHGIVVACVDGRGTGARGEDWRKCHYLKLGTLETEDQISAAQELGKLPYIDASRMGIWGWSYGGYNALMSLCKGDGLFKVGIAVAPVTDWRYYDTVYTERYMRTPAENAAGYDDASVLNFAHALKGKLLLIHGSADDNVHLQNSMSLTERLVEAGIPFDQAIYTDKNHSIQGGNTRFHLYSRMANYLFDNL
ncbi:MAG: S9 family peptidase [Porphyromonas sp.]|nr:S9 family peptidase [Porphyromonas sp.]